MARYGGGFGGFGGGNQMQQLMKQAQKCKLIWKKPKKN